jgi:hypothetical protein
MAAPLGWAIQSRTSRGLMTSSHGDHHVAYRGALPVSSVELRLVRNVDRCHLPALKRPIIVVQTLALEFHPSGPEGSVMDPQAASSVRPRSREGARCDAWHYPVGGKVLPGRGVWEKRGWSRKHGMPRKFLLSQVVPAQYFVREPGPHGTGTSTLSPTRALR